jgi:hypothetical protein
MSIHPTRRALLIYAPQVSLISAQSPRLSAVTNVPDRGPAFASDLVKEFVVAGHANLQRTKELLDLQPGLLNASWDWGGGDFETALGGASHMGDREIAQFLLEKGARMDLFAAAMLGMVEIIRKAVEIFPGIHRSLGPHKISLIAHAQKGGPAAAAVVEYLQQLRAAA